MVDLRTDVACDVVGAKGVTIAVGEPNDDTTGIVASSTYCDAGALGTLALTPSGDIGGPIALRAVLGVNALAENCTPQNQFGGCIVARRSLRYSPHATLSLPIELDQDCLGDPCGPDSTCVHGACTDAGVGCQGNVCAIDAGQIEAGPPDAGSCTNTAPTLVGSTSVMATPRISRTAKGYAIAWMSAAGAIYAEIVDAQGNIISSARPIALLGSTAKIDAVATDTNDQNYFIVYEDAGTFFGTTAPTSGGTATAAPFPNVTGPVDGAFWEATQSVWITAGTKSSAANFYTVASNVPNVSSLISPVNPTHLTLARFGTTYYPTVVEGSSCVLRTCTLQSGMMFGCQPNVFQGCSGMRAAADASNVIVSYVASGTMYFDRIGSSAVADGPVDDVDAMVPLVVGSTPYRIVWRSSGAILTDTFPTKGVAADTLDASGYNVAGAGFDAVADDPAQTGYAVAYYRAGNPTASIELVHRCK